MKVQRNDEANETVIYTVLESSQKSENRSPIDIRKSFPNSPKAITCKVKKWFSQKSVNLENFPTLPKSYENESTQSLHSVA